MNDTSNIANTLLRKSTGCFNQVLFVLITLAGLYLYQHHWDDVNELPIVFEFTDAYQKGIDRLHELSEQAFFEFYTTPLADKQISLQGATDAVEWADGHTNDLPKLTIVTSWQKEAILANLQQKGFSKGKIKAARKLADYIDQYKVLALRDMYQSKVLASIKLAQGLLESGAGQSGLARATNNHFGIKARHSPTARRKIKARQYHALLDEDFIPVKPAFSVHRFHDDNKYDRFEVYHSVGDSYRRHTQLLTRRQCTMGRIGCYNWIWQMFPVSENPYDITQAAKRYQPSSKIAPEDFFNGQTLLPYYAASAAGLKMAGYATSKTYHQKIAYLIETYELWRFDLDLVSAVVRANQ